MVASQVLLGFDFGYARIGVAVGQSITCSANPLSPVAAQQGVPVWGEIDRVVAQWKPMAAVVGIPRRLDGSALYTTQPAIVFAHAISERYAIPVHQVDERFTTVAARSHLFAQGGYKKIKSTSVDSIAACIILEQWLFSCTADD